MFVADLWLLRAILFEPVKQSYIMDDLFVDWMFLNAPDSAKFGWLSDLMVGFSIAVTSGAISRYSSLEFLLMGSGSDV